MNREIILSGPNEKSATGWVNGFIGVVIFSGSLPATRLAVTEFDPVFLTMARAAIAALPALAGLLIFREKLPTRQQLFPLIIVALGVVIGFPLLSALALQYISSAHGIIFIGLLPLATAIFAVLRGGERPRPAFWLFSVIGSSFVIGFAIAQGVKTSPTGDLLMLLAVIVCGLGYAEGAKLSKETGGWQVICWALVLSIPVTLPLLFILLPASFDGIGFPAWMGLIYVTLFSMLIGFIFWYRGLAQGGIAAVGQLQLLQPFFGLALAAGILNEKVSAGMIGITIGVILCVAGSKKFAK